MADLRVTKRYKIRLHVGAHKTATTHLQDILAANEKAILRNGCVYLSRDFVRKTRLLKAVHENHWDIYNSLNKLQSIEQLLVIPEGYPERILISEEDVLGSSSALLDGLYRQARFRLLPWSALAKRDDAQVFLSVRDYADILPSAFSQALRDGALNLPFEEYKALWLTTRTSWMGVIATMVELFGEPQVTVWTMEHYLRNPRHVIKALTGTELTEIPAGAPRATRRLTASVVKKIEQLDPSFSRMERRQAVNALIREDLSTDVFDPLSASEKALLSDRYRQDIERIRRSGLTFLG